MSTLRVSVTYSKSFFDICMSMITHISTIQAAPSKPLGQPKHLFIVNHHASGERKFDQT